MLCNFVFGAVEAAPLADDVCGSGEGDGVRIPRALWKLVGIDKKS